MMMKIKIRMLFMLAGAATFAQAAAASDRAAWPVFTNPVIAGYAPELGEPIDLWKGVGLGHEEGPHIYRIGDYYYLMQAEGGTKEKHAVTMARRPVRGGLADGTQAMWEPCPHNPIVHNDPTTDPEITCTGQFQLV